MLWRGMTHRHLPHLTWLRAFEASARHLSFTHAAQELNLTQAAISKQVRLLEEHLREPLFERRARSLLLTRAGAAYLPKVRDGFERLETGTLEVFGQRRAEMLTLRAPVSYAVNWIAPRLASFTARHPDTPLRLVSSVWNEGFDSQRFDLDIRYGTGRWRGFRADRLTWETVTPVCSPDLARDLRQPADLARHDLLHVLGYEEGWAVWLRAAGATTVHPGGGLHFDTSLMAFAVAARGGGVALARSSVRAPDLETGRLTRPFALETPLQEAFHLLCPEDGRAHPDADKLRDWLLDLAGQDPVNRRNRDAAERRGRA